MILGFRQSASGTANLFEVILIWACLPQDTHSRECFEPLKVTRFETLPKLYICSKRPRGTFASVIASSGSSSIHKGLLQTSKHALWVQGTFHFPLGMFYSYGNSILSLFYSQKHPSRKYLGGYSQETVSKGNKRNDLAFRGAKHSYPELGYKLGSNFYHMKKVNTGRSAF